MAYLPEGTQGVAMQPIGSSGVLVAATDTVRGFGRMDQVGHTVGFIHFQSSQRVSSPLLLTAMLLVCALCIQAWMTALADKLEVSLESAKVPRPGAGFGMASPKRGKKEKLRQ